jgi:hypothetical protein
VLSILPTELSSNCSPHAASAAPKRSSLAHGFTIAQIVELARALV